MHVPALFDALWPCASGQWAKPCRPSFQGHKPFRHPNPCGKLPLDRSTAWVPDVQALPASGGFSVARTHVSGSIQATTSQSVDDGAIGPRAVSWTGLPPRRSSPTAHPAMYGSFAGTCMTHQGRSVHDSPWQWLYDSSKSDWPFMTRQGLGRLCHAGLCGICNACVCGSNDRNLLLRTGGWTSYVIIGALGSDHDLSSAPEIR